MKTSKRMWKLGIPIGIPLALVASYLIFPQPWEYWQSLLIKLPRTRDARLVGTWNGTWRFLDYPELETRTTIFQADGTGSFEDSSRHYPKPFQWGTENGVLYTKRMATDAWSATNRTYSFSADGKTLTFSKDRMFDLVTSSMKRSTPK